MEREAPKRQPHHITDVVLWNLGPVELLKLELQPDWTVFHGENGTGKTTIVDAVESALGARAANGGKLRTEPARPLLTRQLRVDEAEGGIILMTGNGHRRAWNATHPGGRRTRSATSSCGTSDRSSC